MAEKRDYYEVLGVAKTASEGGGIQKCIQKACQEISAGP